MKKFQLQEHYWRTPSMSINFLWICRFREITMKQFQRCGFTYSTSFGAYNPFNLFFLPVRDTPLTSQQAAEIKKLEKRFADVDAKTSTESLSKLESLAHRLAVNYNTPGICPMCLEVATPTIQPLESQYTTFTHCGQEFTTWDISRLFTKTVHNFFNKLFGSSMFYPHELRPDTLFAVYPATTTPFKIPSSLYPDYGQPSINQVFTPSSYVSQSGITAGQGSQTYTESYENHLQSLYSSGKISYTDWSGLMKFAGTHYTKSQAANNSSFFQGSGAHKESPHLKTSDTESKIAMLDDQIVSLKEQLTRMRQEDSQKQLAPQRKSDDLKDQLHQTCGELSEEKHSFENSQQQPKTTQREEFVAKKELLEANAKIAVLEEKLRNTELVVVSTKKDLEIARTAAKTAKATQGLLDAANKEITTLKEKIGNLQSFPAKAEPSHLSAQLQLREELEEFKKESRAHMENFKKQMLTMFEQEQEKIKALQKSFTQQPETVRSAPQPTKPTPSAPCSEAPCTPKKNLQMTQEQAYQALTNKTWGKSEGTKKTYSCCRIRGQLIGDNPVSEKVCGIVANFCNIPQNQLIMMTRVDSDTIQVFCRHKHLLKLQVWLQEFAASNNSQLHLSINCNPLSVEGLSEKSPDALLTALQKQICTLLKGTHNLSLRACRFAERICQATSAKDFEAFFKRYQDTSNTTNDICAYTLNFEDSENSLLKCDLSKHNILSLHQTASRDPFAVKKGDCVPRFLN